MGWIILDALVLAIIVLFIILSAKKGFVRTVIEIVGFLLVFYIASKISMPLASLTYNVTIEPAIIKSVKTDNVSQTLPKYVKNTLGEHKLLEEFENTVLTNLDNGVNNAVKSASQNIVKPIICGVISMIYSMIISAVLMFAVIILAKIINGIFNIGPTSKINAFLGGVFGGVKGIIICMVVCTLIYYIATITQNGFLFFNLKNINSTVIFRHLCLKL